MRFQCQVTHNLSAQACGKPADQVYVCEEIGPHDRCLVGEHTIAHAQAGNGYSCDFIQLGVDYRRQKMESMAQDQENRL